MRRSASKASKASYEKHKEEARQLVLARLAHFNAHYAHRVGRVAIKNHRRRWGSCSSLGNLNFNYKVALLPQELADYVVVHELCHLRELNHGEKFWALVAETLPDWPERRRALRRVRI